MRDTRLRDKIAYSKAIMGSNAAEATRNLEGLIGENLGEVAEKLRAAAGALTENAGAERDRALERARDLVKGLESLRARIGDRQQADTARPDSSQGAREPGSQGVRDSKDSRDSRDSRDNRDRVRGNRAKVRDSRDSKGRPGGEVRRVIRISRGRALSWACRAEGSRAEGSRAVSGWRRSPVFPGVRASAPGRRGAAARSRRTGNRARRARSHHRRSAPARVGEALQ